MRQLRHRTIRQSYSRSRGAGFLPAACLQSPCVNPICFAASILVLCICHTVQSRAIHTGQGGGMQSEITLLRWMWSCRDSKKPAHCGTAMNKPHALTLTTVPSFVWWKDTHPAYRPSWAATVTHILWVWGAPLVWLTEIHFLSPISNSSAPAVNKGMVNTDSQKGTPSWWPRPGEDRHSLEILLIFQTVPRHTCFQVIIATGGIETEWLNWVHFQSTRRSCLDPGQAWQGTTSEKLFSKTHTNLSICCLGQSVFSEVVV